MMTQNEEPEVWLSGPIEGIAALLQPVAHALLQARQEVNEMIKGFPEELLWVKPAGVASVGFHLQHMTGVIDRLFTYARGRELTQEQLDALANEAKPDKTVPVLFLIAAFNRQVDIALYHLYNADTGILTETRYVGRKKIPSTMIGLFVHTAEHVMRHTGQLLVTVNVLRNK